MSNSRATLKSAIDALGFLLGRISSSSLALGHGLIGGIVDRVLSSRAQRLLFIAVARRNAYAVVFTTAAAILIIGTLYPDNNAVTVLLLIGTLPLYGLWLRLAPNASFVLTASRDRRLSVHLPVTRLTPRSMVSMKAQAEKLIHIAQMTHSTALQFDSPLLVASSTRQMLVRCLTRAAEHLNADVTVVVEDAHEVNSVGQGSLSVHTKRYAKLHEGRLARGPNGRLLSRKILVQMNRIRHRQLV